MVDLGVVRQGQKSWLFWTAQAQILSLRVAINKKMNFFHRLIQNHSKITFLMMKFEQ